MYNLGVIVGKPDGSKGASGENRNPHEAVAQVRPQQGRNHDGNGNQQATHGRRAGFLLMRLGPFFPDVLADLKLAQAINDERTDDQSREQGGEAGKCSAKRQITEDAEWREIMEQLQVQQPIKQLASLPTSVLNSAPRMPSPCAPSKFPGLAPTLRRGMPSAGRRHHRGFPVLTTRPHLPAWTQTRRAFPPGALP